MFYKNWPYWLKGGVKTAGIFAIIFIIGLILSQLSSQLPTQKINVSKSNMPGVTVSPVYQNVQGPASRIIDSVVGVLNLSTIPLYILPPLNACVNFLNHCFMGCGDDVYQKYNRSFCHGNLLSITSLLSGIVFYFIIGAVIGLIYGKVKNRNKN